MNGGWRGVGAELVVDRDIGDPSTRGFGDDSFDSGACGSTTVVCIARVYIVTGRGTCVL